MKRIAAMLLCAALAVGLLGCRSEQNAYTPTGDGLSDVTQSTEAGSKEEPRALSLAYYPGKSLNPFLATDYTNRVLFSLIYQGLFTVDRNYQVSPVLCESYNVSADMKTYTFHLAQALFSDGTSVTAADAAASLNAAKESPWYGGRLQHVVSVTGYGSAVVVELDTPMENLPLLLDIPIVKASEVAAAKPLGTGPYRLDESSGTPALRRQAAWWCSAKLPVSAEIIPLTPGESPAQIRDSFEFSQVSLVCTDPASADYVDFRSDYELWDCENGQFLYLVCNEKSKLFSDPGIRAALTHAIDRDALVRNYCHGFAMAATLPASPRSPVYSRTLAARYGYAPDQFTAALNAANPESVEVILMVNGDDVIRLRMAQAIAGMLESCGLKVTLKETSTKNLTDDLRWSEYDLFLGQTKLSANMDVSAFFGINTSLNYGGLSDPAIYAISLEALANSGNFYHLHELIMEEGQLCPVLFQNYAVYTARGAVPELSPARDAMFTYNLGRTLQDALISDE